MTIRHTIDEDRRILLIAVSGVVAGREFSPFVCRLYGERPELFDYECILDLQDYEGELSYADLNPLQQIYVSQPQAPTMPRPGMIVTRDPNFHLWAAALDAQFPNRKHYVVASLEEAFLHLDDLRNAGAA